MLKQDSNYKRLRLGGRGWVNQSSYWIGANHLLVVDVSNYVERYRRFYFRDVQAILVQDTRVRLGWNIGLGCFACLTLVGLLFATIVGPRDNVAATLWFIVFFGFALGLMINTLRGPSCSVHLRTAVQNQKLSGVSRWRKAETLIAALTPLITAAQNSLPTTEHPAVTPTSATPGFIVDDPNAPPRMVS